MEEPGCFHHLRRNERPLDVYTEVRYRWNMKSHEHTALQDQRGKGCNTPVHPGEVLRDKLEEIELTQTALAHHIGVLPKTINEICRGKRGISADMAMKISKALGGSPQFWLNLQNTWELSQVDVTILEDIQPIAALVH